VIGENNNDSFDGMNFRTAHKVTDRLTSQKIGPKSPATKYFIYCY
jgi:hypothetical protein